MCLACGAAWRVDPGPRVTRTQGWCQCGPTSTYQQAVKGPVVRDWPREGGEGRAEVGPFFYGSTFNDGTTQTARDLPSRAAGSHPFEVGPTQARGVLPMLSADATVHLACTAQVRRGSETCLARTHCRVFGRSTPYAAGPTRTWTLRTMPRTPRCLRTAPTTKTTQCQVSGWRAGRA